MLLENEQQICAILSSVKTIALLGASQNPARPSHEVMGFLLKNGFDVIPVNPALAGQDIHAVRVVAHLRDISKPIDMVDIFRKSDAVPGILDEVLALPHRPKLLWMQLGVICPISAKRAVEAGMDVVMDQCPEMILLRNMAG